MGDSEVAVVNGRYTHSRIARQPVRGKVLTRYDANQTSTACKLTAVPLVPMSAYGKRFQRGGRITRAQRASTDRWAEAAHLCFCTLPDLTRNRTLALRKKARRRRLSRFFRRAMPLLLASTSAKVFCWDRASGSCRDVGLRGCYVGRTTCVERRLYAWSSLVAYFSYTTCADDFVRAQQLAPACSRVSSLRRTFHRNAADRVERGSDTN